MHVMLCMRSRDGMVIWQTGHFSCRLVFQQHIRKKVREPIWIGEKGKALVEKSKGQNTGAKFIRLTLEHMSENHLMLVF